MGQNFWKVLHIVAVNFPDGEKEGLSKQRLKGYYDFFNSLQYVLPRSEWRRSWAGVTGGEGDSKLSWNVFEKLRDHRKLSVWLFGVHDSINKDLRKTPSKISYRDLYASYRRYRKGVGHSSKTNTNHPEDAIGLAKMKTMLSRRARAMDTYLVTVYGPSYTDWPQTRKEAARKTHLTEAANWFWTSLSDQAAKSDSTFNSLNVAQRRDRIITQFDFDFRLRHQRVLNTVYGIKGSILDRLQA